MSDSAPATETPSPAVKAPMQLDWKHLAIVVLTVLNALGVTGVIPPAVRAEPAAASDPTFQADVRAALAKQADALSDLRERMARVETTLGAVR